MRILFALINVTALFILGGCDENQNKDKDSSSGTSLPVTRYGEYFYPQLKRIGINYILPAGFTEVRPDTAFHTTRKGTAMYWVMWHFNYDLASLKNEIQISVRLNNMIGSFEHYKGSLPDKEEFSIVNSSFLKDMYGFTDTILYKPCWYPEMIVLKIWNATAAALCETDMEQFYNEPLYAGKFSRCKMLVIHKDNRGDVFIYYWYNEKSADVIDKVIEQTKGMIAFK